MTDVVLLERPAEGVVLLRINRPEARNALNLEVRKLLARHLAECGEDSTTRAIVLTGNEKSFAAGADIKEMADLGTIEAMQRGVHKLWRAIAACPKPVIAAVSGYALGGGCATQRLTRAVGKYKAMKYILTGELFSAKEALDIGLASEVVPDPEVEGRAIDLARQIAALPPLAVQLAKEAVLAGMDAPLSSALALEAKSSQILFSSHDQKEGMRAFIEKRKPRFSGM